MEPSSRMIQLINDALWPSLSQFSQKYFWIAARRGNSVTCHSVYYTVYCIVNVPLSSGFEDEFLKMKP